MEARDLTAAEFEELLDEEAAALEPDVWPILDQFGIETVRMTYTWSFDGRLVSKPIWVIARAGSDVVGYDEVEEEFGAGTVRQEGVVEQWGTYGERLRWTLLHFPGGGGQRKGDARPLA